MRVNAIICDVCGRNICSDFILPWNKGFVKVKSKELSGEPTEYWDICKSCYTNVLYKVKEEVLRGKEKRDAVSGVRKTEKENV